MSKSLGRLIRTLKERCKECGSNLQLRGRKKEQLVDGETTLSLEIQYLYCPVCEFEEEQKPNDLHGARAIENFQKVQSKIEKLRKEKSRARNNKRY